MKQFIIALILITFAFSSKGQVENKSPLFKEIITADSLLFEIGFNTCKTEILYDILSDEFTFYHDQAGITESKEAFIESIRNGLCKLPYKAIRVLDKSSTEIYPLFENGNLYGAIQNGEHSFYALEATNQKRMTSIAKFTHVWIMENEKWKLKSVLSYNHLNVE